MNNLLFAAGTRAAQASAAEGWSPYSLIFCPLALVSGHLLGRESERPGTESPRRMIKALSPIKQGRNLAWFKAREPVGAGQVLLNPASRSDPRIRRREGGERFAQQLAQKLSPPPPVGNGPSWKRFLAALLRAFSAWAA